MWTQLIFIAIYVVFISISNILSRKTLSNGKNTFAFVAIHNLAGSLVVLPLIFFDYRFPLEIGPWLFLLVGVITSIAGDYFYFKSMAIEEVSVLSLVFRTKLILIFILGSLFYQEPITVFKVIAVILVLIGTIIIGYRKGQIRYSKGVILANISNIFLAAMFLVDKEVGSTISVPLYNFINFFTSSLFFFALYWFTNGAKFNLFKQSIDWKYAMTAGVLLSLAALSRRYSFITGEITVASTLINLSVVLTVILGIVVLKEKSNLLQKIVGMIIVVAGAILINL